MFSRDPACDREPKSGAFGSAARGLSTKESLEHARQILRLDSDSCILDAECRCAIQHRNAKPGDSTRIRELDGVVEKDHYELPDERCISNDGRFFEFLDGEIDALLTPDDAGGAHRIDRDIIQEEPLSFQRALARICARENEQAVHDSAG